MPFTVDGYEVVDTVQENGCTLQVVKHKVKYVPVVLSAKELSELCENVYHGSLNIKNKTGIFEYIDNICYSHELGLLQKFDIIYYVLAKRDDL